MNLPISLIIIKFLFVLSIVYILRFLAEFGIRLFLTITEPMSITKTEAVFLYLSVAYFITYFLI